MCDLQAANTLSVALISFSVYSRNWFFWRKINGFFSSLKTKPSLLSISWALYILNTMLFKHVIFFLSQRIRQISLLSPSLVLESVPYKVGVTLSICFLNNDKPHGDYSRFLPSAFVCTDRAAHGLCTVALYAGLSGCCIRNRNFP